MYVAWNCGIIFGFQELFTSESISQVFHCLLSQVDYATEHNIKLPEVGAYDDVCALAACLPMMCVLARLAT